MKRTTKTALLAAGAVALGLATTMVAAHPGGYGQGYGPGSGMGPGMMGGGPGWGGMGPGAMQGADPAVVLEPRLAATKAQLKITSEQEAAWQAYATQMKTRFQSMQAWMTTMHSNTPATPAERMELHAAMLKQRAEVAEATSKAFKELYDVLTPEQRALVDQGQFATGPGFGRGPGGRYR